MVCVRIEYSGAAPRKELQGKGLRCPPSLCMTVVREIVSCGGM